MVAKWYRKSEEFYESIRQQFGDLVEEVIAAENKATSSSIDAWLDSPKGCVAAMVVLDQFPRNLYRGSPKGIHYRSPPPPQITQGEAYSILVGSQGVTGDSQCY